MTKQEIIDYIMTTPSNPNKAVLEGMLDSFSDGEGGGGDEMFANFLMAPNVGTIVLPKGIDTINSSFFVIMKASNISNVEIPGDFNKGSANGFTGCKNLKSVKLDEGIISIAGDAESFGECTALNNVDFSSTVKTIGSSAFQNCTNLTVVDFPGHINKIMMRAFYGCSSLSRVIFRDVEPPTTVGSNAFTGCSDSLTFYVPDEAVDAYKAVSGLSSFVDKILPISALEA